MINQTGLGSGRGKSEGSGSSLSAPWRQTPATSEPHQLATALGDLGREEEELKVLDEALELEPKYLRALLLKAGTLEQRARTAWLPASITMRC